MTNEKYPKHDEESLRNAHPISSIPELLFGDNLRLREKDPIEYDEINNRIHIFLEDTREGACCPHCGQYSVKEHSTYERNPQWVPINNVNTTAHIKVHRYFCENPDCPCKTFSSCPEGVRECDHRSIELNLIIFAISIFCSETATAMICADLGIDVSHDSVRRLIDHVKIEDEPDVEFVGVDDVAVRKGQTYQTVVYDGEDHHLLALLDGRDAEALKEWLKNHPMIKRIARDRASAYARAITEILPDCEQVADRFHLLDNLLKSLYKIFKKDFPEKVYIQNGKIFEDKPEPDSRANLGESKFEGVHYDNTPPIDDKGKIIQFSNKIRNTSKLEIKKGKLKREQKYRTVIAMRNEWKNSQKTTKKALAEKYDKSMLTVRKYLEMSDEEVEQIKEVTEYKKRKDSTFNYSNIIFKMLRDGFPKSFIYSYIIYQGYKGSPKTLRNYIRCIAVQNFSGRIIKQPAPTKKEAKESAKIVCISRREVFKYLTINDRSKMKNSNVAKYFDLIRENFPIVTWVEDAWKIFHRILMGVQSDQDNNPNREGQPNQNIEPELNNKPDALDAFIEDYSSSPISTFVSGLKKDIAPVKNAISSDVSSGFVEGGNCRYKQTKRVMFGRATLNHLFHKTYAISIIMRTAKTARDLFFDSYNS